MDRLEKVIEIMKSGCSATCCEREGCIYYNGDCNLDYLIDVLFRFDKVIKKEKSITLKNIDTSMSFHELRNKLIEYREKFENAVINCILSNYCVEDAEEYDKYAIESLWNMIQTGLEMINMAGISADDVMKGYSKYLEKIKK